MERMVESVEAKALALMSDLMRWNDGPFCSSACGAVMMGAPQPTIRATLPTKRTSIEIIKYTGVKMLVKAMYFSE